MITFSLTERGPIIDLLIRNKIAKNISSANTILLLISILSLGTTFLVSNQFFNISSASPTYLEDIPENIRQTLPAEILNQIPSRKSI